MDKDLKLTGRCMCGAVKITATASEPHVAVCHCDMCRRWSAGPFMEITCQTVAFEDEEKVGRIRSSDWAERGFCNQCGSNLFYHIIDSGDYQVSAGLFDDQSMFQMSLQVFSDRRPPYYEFSNKTKLMTAAEVFAAFAPPQE